MSVSGMSQTRLRAWLATVIWVVAGTGFLFAFFSGGGVQEFDTDSGRHLMTAGAIGFGFIGYWTALWLTRSRGDQIRTDERDFQVLARASQATLVVVLIAVFSISVGLWTVYESAGVVHVGWMWFIAYGTMFLGLITNSLTVLIMDGRTGLNG